MSKRADPDTGRKTTGDAPKRARQMTVYDKLEDARRRRHELLAKGNGPAPRPVPNLKASNEARAPHVPPAAPNVVPAPPKPLVATPMPATEAKPVLSVTPEPRPAAKRAAGAYWKGLLQAMAAIAVAAVLFAVFSAPDAAPEATANATTPPAPAPVVSEPVSVEEPAVVSAPVVTQVAVDTTAPAVPVAPETTSLGLTIAPLINPTFADQVATLATFTPDSLPLIFDTSTAVQLPQTIPPLVLTSVPPPRPVTEVVDTPAVVGAQTDFADATNVVLLVPAFVPQSDAENAIETAAALGIPVDQTRRASVSISQTNIRYFHAEDAEAATILAAGLGGIARDFTDFTPPPNTGVIEVWIAGRGGSTTSSQGSATARGLEADLEALRNSIARALSIASGN